MGVSESPQRINIAYGHCYSIINTVDFISYIKTLCDVLNASPPADLESTLSPLESVHKFESLLWKIRDADN